MRYLLLFGLVLLIATSTHAQFTYIDHHGEEQLWGDILPEQLQKAPYATWFTTSYEEAILPASLPPWRDELSEVEVVIFLGTWCSDSQEWVPKFLHLWDALELPANKLRLVSLHNSDDLRKKGPDGEEEGWNIQYIPTFIFLKDGQELDRIVEYPLTTLLEDLEQIAGQLMVH